MLRSRTQLALLLALFVVACTTDRTADDGGALPDAATDATATVRDDAGAQPDAFVMPVDEISLPSAPFDAGSRFGGEPESSRAIELVYPEDDTFMPGNVGTLEIHFRPAAGQTVFAIDFDWNGRRLTVFSGCGESVGGGCVVTLGDEVWPMLSTRRGGIVRWQVRGADDTGAMLGVSPSRALHLSVEDVTGGMYFWNASAASVRRAEFGRSDRLVENFVDARTRDVGASICVGCHAVSRDGSRLMLGMDMPGFLQGVITMDVQSRAVLSRTTGLAMFGLSTNGREFAANRASDGLLVTGSTDDITVQQPIMHEGRALAGTMPDFSRDGSRMVYVEGSGVGGQFQFIGTSGGGLYMLERDVTDAGASAWRRQSAPLLLADAANNFYPAFSPDDAWVAFTRSPSNGGSSDAADADLFVVPSTRGMRIRLARASADGVRDAWSKWDTNVYDEGGTPLFWITFISHRPVGLHGGTERQLWMAAVDPTALGEGIDGSYPAFHVPAQEDTGENLLPYWVTSVIRTPCVDDAECRRELDEFARCESGLCVAGPV